MHVCITALMLQLIFSGLWIKCSILQKKSDALPKLHMLFLTSDALPELTCKQKVATTDDHSNYCMQCRSPAKHLYIVIVQSIYSQLWQLLLGLI